MDPSDARPAVHDRCFWVVIVVFISIALYNVVELNFLIATTFRQFRGLYFWSLVATWGIAFNAAGYLLRTLDVDPSGFVHSTVLLVGWCTMVTGQSLVLYSRLHLVLHQPSLLRLVLAMIVVDATCLGIPVIVLVYGSNSTRPQPSLAPYSVFEKLQLSVFTVQELIISALYIVETTRILRLQRGLAPTEAPRVLSHLILVNVFVILLDVSVLSLEFTEHYDIQTAWKPVVYSVKLKVEFSVLNWLVDVVQRRGAGTSLPQITSSVGTDPALERCTTTAPVTPTAAFYEDGHGKASRNGPTTRETHGPDALEKKVASETDSSPRPRTAPSSSARQMVVRLTQFGPREARYKGWREAFDLRILVAPMSRAWPPFQLPRGASGVCHPLACSAATTCDEATTHSNLVKRKLDVKRKFGGKRSRWVPRDAQQSVQ